MSKYDFEIDLSRNTSTGLILNKMKKGSVVLEFGCAAGRMTRYMKEELDCRVYIVEYDAQAYETARLYAEDGLCDDIMQLRWLEKFRDISFDAIVFADVLEHLPAPEKVLAQAASLLSDSGSIYVSLPNVTHNDIVLKAYDEHFDYTATGLLDDTHIHFWGLHNIGALAEKSGLHIRSIEETFCPMGGTEQQPQIGRHLLLENILRERQCGEVYQFVVTFDKREDPPLPCTFRAPVIFSFIYLDTGKDFNAEEVVAIHSQYSGRGSYVAHYEMENPGTVRRLRFDPVEGQGCILRRVSICQDGQPLELIIPNGLPVEDGYLLPGTDPLVYVNVNTDGGPLSLDAEIILTGEAYLDMLQGAFENNCAELECVRGEKRRIALDNDRLCKTIAALREDEGSPKKPDDMTQALRLLQQDIAGYIMLANNKEKYVLELKRQVWDRDRHIQDQDRHIQDQDRHIQDQEHTISDQGKYIQDLHSSLRDHQAQIAHMDDYIRQLDQVVNYYQNLRIIKLRAFVARVIRGVGRRIRRLTGNKEQTHD